jgi:hypothetical protein
MLRISFVFSWYLATNGLGSVMRGPGLELIEKILMSDSGLSDIGLSCFIIGLIRYRTEAQFFPILDKALSISDIGDKNI